jgi:hypothetical protein
MFHGALDVDLAFTASARAELLKAMRRRYILTRERLQLEVRETELDIFREAGRR